MNFKFYLISSVLLTAGFFLGFFVGRDLGHVILIKFFGEPYGEGIFALFIYGSIIAILSAILGIFISLIIIHRLGRRWGSSLSFGSHPVLKLTFLSFLTFLGLLILLLFLLPTSSK